VEVYESEREQIDAIKKWWNENGKAIVIGVILGLGSLIGWQQWQASVKAQRETASMEYDLLLSELDKKNYQGVKDHGARILSDFSNTPYAASAALALAKVDVEENDYAAAKTYLQMVIDQDKQPQLKQVAQLRKARLLLAEGETDQALALLKSVKAGGFTVAVNELEGDIQVALGNRDLARTAYQRALDAAEQGMDTSVLQMKLDDLGGSMEADS
jgi:predicted negative regulator of RcsB-dependent stress response